MEANYKIAIPKPCHEDWDQMTPDQTGRFCGSCAKSVVDFTGMKTPEIQEYFIKNQGQKVCGRFKNEQLDSIIIQIPRDVLFSQMQFHKMFLLALLISMGTTLFSCQSETGKKKIDKIEVVDSTTNVTMGLPLPAKNPATATSSTTNVPQTFNFKGISNSGVTTGMTGVIPVIDSMALKKQASQPFITGEIAAMPQAPAPVVMDKDIVYQSSRVEVQPTYPGGLAKFYDVVKSDFKVPEEYKNSTGKIILSFVVDTDGSLTDVKVLRGINPALDQEALRFMKDSPKWIPGQQNGEKVRVLYAIPIKITAQE